MDLSIRGLRGIAAAGPATSKRAAASLFMLSADQDPRDAQRRLTVSDGHALAVLAARADAPADVPADLVDGPEDLRSDAEKVGVPHHMLDLAVLHGEPFVDFEDELARGRVDLPAAHA